ncbi:uncharacterized protein BX663DRAFT_510160 [Cokeromyces recurvatus]|uniref:uncharacterized protein n=1 Tax=Cokeromyces recurvatus TaxID=90255 RepID=UPI0022208EF9|nr:uncharacterized protein BX663DRAFT_510160 [Cokeromyces recurvatus]KAI7902695.1 hypothetical protein BX663DRAFT_510160 [Cokeromyces recurvatus]
MMASLMRTKHSNIDFNIMFYPQYQNEEGRVICHPGSVFEGVVQMKVLAPMSVHHIKLVFKATERVNYDAMGWEKSNLHDDRLFAVRTILWGLPSGLQIPIEDWPILEPGDYHFPFICQMPVINFPPTFHHHLIAINFQLIVSVNKAGETSPILSKPAPVYFQPIIETLPVKNQQAFIEENRLTNHIIAQVSVPRLAYNVLDKNQSIPITIQFYHSDSFIDQQQQQQYFSISQLRAYIKRYYNINYKTFSRSETAIIADYDYPKLPTMCPSTVTINLDLSNLHPRELPATLIYSPHLKIEYKLVITVKVRHGPIHVKKKLFDMSLVFGTLPAGTRAPRQLESYSAIVENLASIHSKPQFLRPIPNQEEEEQEEFLPAYNSEVLPPDYHEGATSNNHVQIVEISS